MVGTGGLEPPTSCVSGRRSNQLSYAPIADFRRQDERSVYQPAERGVNQAAGTRASALSRIGSASPRAAPNSISGSATAVSGVSPFP